MSAGFTIAASAEPPELPGSADRTAGRLRHAVSIWGPRPEPGRPAIYPGSLFVNWEGSDAWGLRGEIQAGGGSDAVVHPWLRARDLRTGYGAELAQSGLHLELVAKVLGNTKAVAEKYYARPPRNPHRKPPKGASGRARGAGSERLTRVKMPGFLAQNLALGAKKRVLRNGWNVAIFLMPHRMRT